MEKVVYCVDCGQPFISKSNSAKRCTECRAANKKELSRKRKKGYRQEPSKSIAEVMRELKAYNEKHGTFISYGQYVSKVEGG